MASFKPIARPLILTMKTGAFLILSAVLLALTLFSLRYLGLDEYIYAVLDFIENAGISGQLIFAAIMAGSVIFMLPSVMFTVGAGYLFGVVHGATLVVVSETAGATVAFLIARYALGDKAALWLKQRAKLAHVSQSVLSHGWRVIAAFRAIPFFPFKVSNYFFGLLPISFSHYVAGTFIGLWPITLFNVYLGSLTSDIVSTVGEPQARTTTQWAIYTAGFLISIAAVVYITRLATKTLADYNSEPPFE